MFSQSSPLSSSVVRMEFGREVFHDGLEPLDASRLAQGEKVRCATSAFHNIPSPKINPNQTLTDLSGFTDSPRLVTPCCHIVEAPPAAGAH